MRLHRMSAHSIQSPESNNELDGSADLFDDLVESPGTCTVDSPSPHIAHPCCSPCGDDHTDGQLESNMHVEVPPVPSFEGSMSCLDNLSSIQQKGCVFSQDCELLNSSDSSTQDEEVDHRADGGPSKRPKCGYHEPFDESLEPPGEQNISVRPSNQAHENFLIISDSAESVNRSKGGATCVEECKPISSAGVKLHHSDPEMSDHHHPHTQAVTTSIKDSLTRLDGADGSSSSVSAHDHSQFSSTSDGCAQASSSELICPFCHIQESSIFRLEFHIEVEHNEMSTQDVTFASGRDNFFGESMSETTAATAKKADALRFVCPLCDLDLGEEELLTLHLNVDHEEPGMQSMRDAAPSGSGVSCPLCGISGLSEKDMKEHIQSHSSDHTFYGVSTSEHPEPAVSPKPTLVCPMCQLAMNDPDLLTSHVESHFNPQHSPAASIDQVSPATFSSRAESNKENVAVIGCSQSVRVEPAAKVTASGLQVCNKNPMAKQEPRATTSSRSQETVAASCSNRVSQEEESGREGKNFLQLYQQNMEKAVAQGKLSVAEYHERKQQMGSQDWRKVDDGKTRVAGLIEKLARFYPAMARPAQRVLLCAPTDHFSGSFGDKGWGCGYRNFQIILSCLLRLPEYSSRVFPDGSQHIPSIPKIQQMLETAWKNGFDPQGCRQLAGRVVNTTKWIGATEIVAILSSLGVRCRLADFHAPSSPDGTHPRLLEWVTTYFQRGHSSSQVLPPLYLQHQGHSRTIIGVELDRETTRLLLFDPGTPYDQMENLRKNPFSWKQMRTFRRTQAAFKAKQYQVVAIEGLLTNDQYQESKILQSERVS